MLNTIKQLLNKSSLRYLIVGGSSLILDAGLLFVFHDIFNLHIGVSTTLAYWVAVSYNFTLTRIWTFNSRESNQLIRHISFYLLLLAFNYTTTLVFIWAASYFTHYLIAKVIIVAAQTVWNYPIYKNYIFHK